LKKKGMKEKGGGESSSHLPFRQGFRSEKRKRRGREEGVYNKTFQIHSPFGRLERRRGKKKGRKEISHLIWGRKKGGARGRGSPEWKNPSSYYPCTCSKIRGREKRGGLRGRGGEEPYYVIIYR